MRRASWIGARLGGHEPSKDIRGPVGDETTPGVKGQKGGRVGGRAMGGAFEWGLLERQQGRDSEGRTDFSQDRLPSKSFLPRMLFSASRRLRSHPEAPSEGSGVILTDPAGQFSSA